MPFPVTHGKRRPGATNGPREERPWEGGRTQREEGEERGLNRGEERNKIQAHGRLSSLPARDTCATRLFL